MPWKQIYVYVNYVYIIIDWGIRAPHYRQLVSMTKPGSTLTFTYDADGNRTSKTVNGVTTMYTYVDGRITHETNGTDTIHYRYDTNGTLLSMNLNGTEYYYLYNGQRDVIGLYDASGNVVVEYTYDAWGKPLTTTGSLASTVGAKNPYRYRGYRYDAETGLYALTTRYYNAQIGRFINADDAYILEDKDKEEFESNLFAYCVNNPVNRIDTLGLLSTTQKLWITAGIVTAAAIIISVASAGAATPLACTLIGASYGAIAGAAYGAASGLVTGAITGGIETRSWSGAAQGALDGAADSALSGTVTGAISGGMTNPYCFIAGTLICTATGEKAIEKVVVGEFVLSENPETEEVAYKRVLNTYVNQTDELGHVKIEGEDITATLEHPFYSPIKGWTAAVDLRQGDILVTVNGQYVVVEAVEHERLDEPISVYNFEVEDFHTYCVGNIDVLVHNACTVVKENGVKIESYYPNDHGNPTHLHVNGGGPSTKIGPQGKPVAGYPSLTPKQQKVVNKHIVIIKKVIKQAQKQLKNMIRGIK